MLFIETVNNITIHNAALPSSALIYHTPSKGQLSNMLSVLIFLLSASAILAANIDDGLKDDDKDRSVVQVPVFFVAGEHKRHHIPLDTESDLNLTPNQLKLFTGHALNLVQAKCPKVDKDGIFQVQKYIGKYIASRMESTPKTSAIDGSSQKAEFDGLIKSLITCAKEDRPKTDKNKVMKILFAPIDMKADGGKQSIQDNDESHAAEPGHVLLGFQSQIPKETPQKEEAKPEQHSPFIRWIKSVMQDIKNFFSGMLSSGGRQRRASGTTPTPSKHLTAEQLKGREAIMDVIDQVCRIYCDECSDVEQTMNFRMAVKEFMQFIFSDENLLIYAAHAIPESFINSLASCDLGP